MDTPLESGYSGSPLFDSNTNHIIGIVNIREGDDKGYAIDIKYVKELIADIEVSVLEDNINQEHHEKVARVIFEPKSNDKYKVRINQTELFDGESVCLLKKQEKIIEKINNYCTTLDCGAEREPELELIELVIPHSLFNKDIPLWEDGDGDNLVSNVEVLIRNIAKTEQSLSKKEASKILWNSTIESNNTFVNLSAKVSGKNFMKDKTKLVAYVNEVSSEETPFKKVVSHSHIVLWINRCENVEQYTTFLEEIIKETVNDFPSKFRDKLTKSTDSCAFNANLMWDNPNTLPKAYYE